MAEIRVLGVVEVRGDDGSALAIGGPRQRRLVAALALELGSSVSDARLIDVVWPGGDIPGDPRNSLQTYVSRLRSAGLVVERSGSGYVLPGEAAELDAQLFEQELATGARLRERDDVDAAAVVVATALDRWRGQAFGDFADEEWARGEATRLDELRIRGREMLAELTIERGEPEVTLADLRSLCAEHPLRDAPHRLLMSALHAMGDQAAALRVFQEFRARLIDETGLEPSAELAELERRIVTGEEVPVSSAMPSRLGSYEVGELVGEGAFGAIYRASQPSVGRDVAIKVVRPELANDPAFVRRFEVEAQTVARLEHPHIVPLYDYWRDPTGAYLVMRYLSGGSAEQRLVEKGPWPLEDVARLVDEIGPALAVAHDAGVLHRDIKPGNVLFDEFGNAYLADFGIAAEVGSAQRADLRSAGSPLYVSPEQVRDGESSTASDIYGFGVVLYELLTGRPPFSDSGSVQALLDRKVREVVPSVTADRPDVPTGVDLVVQTATATEPARRFPSMGELVLAFRAAVGDAIGGAATTGAPADVVGDGRPRFEAARTLVGLELEGMNPYRGLAAFDEADSDEFHGRDVLIAELLAQLEASRFLVVTGPSGSGKSSVVRAGLLPSVRESGAFVASIVPGVHPMDELETALLRVATEPTGALVEQLNSDDRGLSRAVRTLLPDDGSELVLVVDQFEELFTLTPEDRRDHFLASLAAAVTDERSRLRVVCTLRADFYDRPLQHPAVAELVRVNTAAVTPLTGEELDQAITQPAAKVGVTVEPVLVAELIAHAAGQAATLPMLQYALTELYERRTGGRMTLQSYRDIGGLTGVLANRADELYEQMTPDEQAGVHRLFTRLVTPGEGTEDTRRRVLRSELSGVPTDVIDLYGSARLLTFDNDPTSREPTVEVAHEALIREWPRLRGWLDDDRDGLRILRHLGQSAGTWSQTGRDDAELYRGGRLETAEEWASNHMADLTALELEFLESSTSRRTADETAERTRLRRLRILLGATALVAAVAALAGAVAFQQRGQANDARDDARSAETSAETRRLGSEAVARVDDDPQVALLLAAEAYRREPGPASLGALQRVLTRVDSFLGVLGAGRPYTHVHWIDDQRIAAAGPDRISVFDATTRVEDAAYGHGVAAQTGQPSGDGTEVTISLAAGAGAQLAAVSVDDPLSLDLVDLTTGRIMRAALEHPDPVDRVAISPDGATAVTLDGAGTLRAFDTSTGRLIWSVDAHPEEINADVTLPDGVTLPVLVPDFAGFVDQFSLARPHGLTFTADGATLVSSEGSVVRFWDPATGESSSADLTARASTPVGDVAWTARHLATVDSELLIINSRDMSVHDLDAREHRTYFSIEGTGVFQSLPKINDVEPMEPGVLAVLLTDGRLARVSTADGTFVGPPHNLRLSGTTDAALSPDGSSFVVASAEGVGLYSLSGEQLLADAAPREGAKFGDISRDGHTISVAHSELLIFEPPTPRIIDMTASPPRSRSLPEPSYGAHLYPGSDLVFYADANISGRSYDPQTLEQIGHYPTGVGWIGSTVSNDGEMYAIGTFRNGIRIWDIHTGTQLAELTDFTGAAHAVSFSADNTRLAAAAMDGSAIVYRTDDWSIVDPSLASPASPIASLRYSPDGRYLVTMDSAGRISLRDPLSHEVLTTLIGNSDVLVPDAQMWFSNDGRYLTTGGDGKGRMWDLEAGQQLGDPFPNDPDFRPGGNDGPHLLTAVDDSLLVWNLDVTTWFDIACEAAGRNLTAEEWRQFGPSDEPQTATCPRWPGDESEENSG